MVKYLNALLGIVSLLNFKTAMKNTLGIFGKVKIILK